MSIKEVGTTLADSVAKFIGSWTFIILQTLMVTIWIAVNIVSYTQHYDPYPFILLNLFFSTEAAYATPLILMSSIRQASKDSATLSRDLKLDMETNKLMKKLSEDIKIDKLSLEDHKVMQKDIQIIKDTILKENNNANIY